MAWSAAARRRLALLLRLLAACAGVTLVIVLLHALGAAQVAVRLRSAGAGFLAVIAAYLATVLVYALPFGLLLPDGAKLPLTALAAGRLAATSVSAATPFLGLGGEPTRLLWLPSGRRGEGAVALVLDRSAFLLASALFLVAGVTSLALLHPLPRSAAMVLAVAAVAILGLALLLVTMERGRGIAQPVAWLVRRLPLRKLHVLEERAIEFDRQVRAVHRNRAGRVIAASVLHLAGRCLSSLEILVAGRLVGLPLGAADALVLASVPLLSELAFPMVPSQLGVREGAMAVLAPVMGLDPAGLVAVVFLQRLRQLVLVPAGFTLLALRRQRGARIVEPSAAGSGPAIERDHA